MLRLLFLLLMAKAQIASANQINNNQQHQLKFHKPETEAEKTLDVIFKMQSVPDWEKPVILDDIKQVNQKLYEFTLQNGTKGHFNKVKEFALTKKLNVALQKIYDLEKDCEEGYICGLGYNLITCGQDYPSYKYYTTKEEKNIAYISWNTYNSFKFIKADNEWKLDGIKCDNDYFNYLSSSPANLDSDK